MSAGVEPAGMKKAEELLSTRRAFALAWRLCRDREVAMAIAKRAVASSRGGSHERVLEEVERRAIEAASKRYQARWSRSIGADQAGGER